jgi:hypothetical protein
VTGRSGGAAEQCGRGCVTTTIPLQNFQFEFCGRQTDTSDTNPTSAAGRRHRHGTALASSTRCHCARHRAVPVRAGAGERRETGVTSSKFAWPPQTKTGFFRRDDHRYGGDGDCRLRLSPLPGTTPPPVLGGRGREMSKGARCRRRRERMSWRKNQVERSRNSTNSRHWNAGCARYRGRAALETRYSGRYK